MISRLLLAAAGGGAFTVSQQEFSDVTVAAETTHNDSELDKSAGNMAEKDGVIYHVYGEGSGGEGAAGYYIQMETTDDEGATWGSAVTIATPDSGRTLGGAGICVSSTGRLIVSYHDSEDGAGFVLSSSKQVIYSDDDGATWSDDYAVPFDVPDNGFGSCSPLELPNGDILLPAFGEFNGEYRNYVSFVYRSTDDGETFPDEFVVSSANNPNETHLLVDGTDVVAFLRTDTGSKHTWRSVSSDGGETWGTPVDVSTMTGRPTMGEIAPDVLVFVGRNNTTDQFRRWAFSLDNGVTFSTPAEFDPGDTRTAGYAALQPISGTRLLCLDAYDLDDSTIFQRIFTAS